MKKLLALLLFASTVSFAGTCTPNPATVRLFDFTSTSSITTTAANVNMPTTCLVAMVQIGAPSTNTDVIYVSIGTATSSKMPIAPGNYECVPLLNTNHLSMISATGTQSANLVVYCK